MASRVSRSVRARQGPPLAEPAVLGAYRGTRPTGEGFDYRGVYLRGGLAGAGVTYIEATGTHPGVTYKFKR